MIVTDPIADMLTRIRNAIVSRKETVDVPASNMKKAIAQILLDEGYVAKTELLTDTVQGTIRITLKYADKNKSVITGLQRVSRPGLRRTRMWTISPRFWEDWASPSSPPPRAS